ncbi:MAG TPA: hypothetical protein VHO27_05480 [Angustibacter sp.]|nr:hypothetical protein [Angustibacter sp.]
MNPIDHEGLRSLSAQRMAAARSERRQHRLVAALRAQRKADRAVARAAQLAALVADR